MITPQQARQLNDVDHQMARDAEMHIDQALKAFSGSPVRVDLLKDLNAKTREAIEQKYRAAGWHVERVPCQRDGDYWRFSEAHQSGPDTSSYYRDR
jgi:hypothetical protein